MSLSCSDCFSDLLCGEATSSIISSGGGDYSPGYSSDFESQPLDSEESIAGLLEDERDLARISSCRSIHQQIDASVRAEFVAWILKVSFYLSRLRFMTPAIVRSWLTSPSIVKRLYCLNISSIVIDGGAL